MVFLKQNQSAMCDFLKTMSVSHVWPFYTHWLAGLKSAEVINSRHTLTSCLQASCNTTVVRRCMSCIKNTHTHWKHVGGSAFLACVAPFHMWKVHGRQRRIAWSISHLYQWPCFRLADSNLLQEVAKPLRVLRYSATKRLKGSASVLMLATSAAHRAME